MLRVDSLEAETKSLDLKCGDDAKHAADSRRKLGVDATAHRVQSADVGAALSGVASVLPYSGITCMVAVPGIVCIMTGAVPGAAA